eukprot:TRINITY_DN2148_c0_g1_i1.p1 TRINITY_DN2148_c0_g1~~TRINITY_DN2148_c0_g1_i1.p1  ORF type:complete len:1639 (+),score=352.12 TRINITY_DN2148_c0_g1_i1:139-5055(+)
MRGRGFDPFKRRDDISTANDTFCDFVDLGVKQQAKIINSTKAVCISPPSPVLRETVLEITLNNQQYTDDEVKFHYYRPPMVYEIDPAIGPTAGGTKVYIIGSNFNNTGKIKCKFGSIVVPGTFINVNNILCVSPPAEKPGYVPLQLSMYEDEFSSGENVKYLYYENTILNSIGPTCGPERGYTQLTVLGANFIDTGFDMVKCIFNYSDDTTDEVIFMNATIMNDETIKCSTPPVLDRFGANAKKRMYYDVTITLNNKRPEKASYFRFNYYKEVTIKSVEPPVGPVEGGTLVKIKGKNFDPPCGCNHTMRFGAMQFKLVNKSDDTLFAIAPPVSLPDDVVVAYGINGQQYNPDPTINFKDLENTYTYYEKPIISEYDPEVGPSTGGTKIIMKGHGLTPFKDNKGKTKARPLFLRMNNTNPQKGEKKTMGPIECVYISSDEVHFITPPGKPDSNHIFEISYNKQNYLKVIPKGKTHSYTYYLAPEIESISPPYGPVKADRDIILKIKGKNFKCPKGDCTKIKVRFGVGEDAIYVTGTRVSDTEIQCKVPKYSKPEVMKVDLTLNDLDYTDSGATYGYFDPYVKKVIPKMVSTEGNTTIRIYGHGFVNTTGTFLNVKYDNKTRPIVCNGKPCIKKARYISQYIVEAETFAMKDVVYEDTSEQVGTDEFCVEVSVYGNDYTENNITIFYFYVPEYGKISETILPSNGNETIIVPSNFKTKYTDKQNPLNQEEWFKKYGKVKCRWTSKVANDTTVYYTEGTFTHYPLQEADFNNAITCKSPEVVLPDGMEKAPFQLDISVNGGADYSGKIVVTITEKLEIFRIFPPCGPNYGATKLRIVGTGFHLVENINMKWGTVSVSDLDKKTSDNWYYNSSKKADSLEETVLSQNEEAKLYFKENRKYRVVSTKAPKLPYYAKTWGGPVYIQLGRTTELQVFETKEFKIWNYGPSFMEYYYYKQPVMKALKPRGGPVNGGTNVIIKGAYFRYRPEYGVIPYAKFGEKITRCTFESTVRIICKTPPNNNTGTNLPVGIGMNGVDFTNVGDFRFHYYEPPEIVDFSPKSGPESGGTNIRMIGRKFTDLSGSRDFLCRFTSKDLKIPPKYIPAIYENETSIMCASPGGWGSGSAVNVEISFNGEDFTESNSTFFFYNIFGALPRSGPSDGSAGTLNVLGSGFRNGSNIIVSFDGVHYKPFEVTWNEIKCKIPKSSHGEDFFGNVPLEVTINGLDYHKFEGGFQYYPQVNASEFFPKTGPAKGKGIITFVGKKFRSDFDLARPACRFGPYYGVGEVIDETEMKCYLPEFKDVNQTYLGEVALNNQSFVPALSKDKFFPYDIEDINPSCGPINHKQGTLITIEGTGFSKQAKARCRFGSKGDYAIVDAKVIDETKMICKTPHKFDVPKIAEMPLSVPFSIALLDDKYEPWTESGHKFRFYEQPTVGDIDPHEGMVGEMIEVNVYAKVGNQFMIPLAPTTPQDHEAGIICKFGRFGEAPGTFVNETFIKCITPATTIDPNDIYREDVYVRVAINGQTWTDENDKCLFTFLGNATYFVYWPYFIGFILVALLLIAAIMFLASLWSRLMIPQKEGNVQTALAPHAIRDDFGLMRTRSTYKPKRGGPGGVYDSRVDASRSYYPDRTSGGQQYYQQTSCN